MHKMCLKRPANCYVLAYDEEFNGMHCGGQRIIKSPVECLLFDPTGANRPVLFGYPENTFPTQLNNLIAGDHDELLVPLAYEAVLSPSGAVLALDSSRFATLEEWIEAIRPGDKSIEVDVIERPWGISEAAAQLRSRTYSKAPF